MGQSNPIRIKAISTLGRELVEQDLTKGSGGNVSVRQSEQVAVSPSGVDYYDVTPEKVPIVDLEGNRLQGDLEPSNETPMHTLIYQARDDVGGIVHTHSPYAGTFASLGKPIPPSHYLIAFAGKEVPVTGYEHPGTEELGELAVEALGTNHDACLLQNHGVMAVGEDGEEALETAVMVEYCARIHYQASAIGEPVLMDSDNLDYLVDIFGTYRQKNSHGD